MTRAVAVVVLLALASPARAETPESADLKAGQPAPADGSWLRADVARATLKRCSALELQLRDSEKKRDELALELLRRPAEPATSTSVAVVVAGGLGLVVGLVAGGWLVLKATR